MAAFILYSFRLMFLYVCTSIACLAFINLMCHGSMHRNINLIERTNKMRPWIVYYNTNTYFLIAVCKTKAAITVFELLMMGGVLPETCWAIKKHWNNKFYYTVASCWFFLWDLLLLHVVWKICTSFSEETCASLSRYYTYSNDVGKRFLSTRVLDYAVSHALQH